MTTPHSGDGRYDVLFETTRGRLTHCRCCGELELRFGNALLALNGSDFDPLRQTVAELEADAVAARDRGPLAVGARAELRLGDSGVGFAFDAEELVELHRLLEGGALLLELTAS